ncbi:hypothetical protein CYMTET_15669 [Cymbomonas tetramitiformis]|uniref:Uncharacterized protein n=1 Tax=Cymbomonas tetramitiformis TaxID=36881 RepID=A0AAE0L939_9CHLO|nr:hypothetical protein CYMTET_15669 [Cymbomonas tetramitiformis]
MPPFPHPATPSPPPSPPPPQPKPPPNHPSPNLPPSPPNIPPASPSIPPHPGAPLLPAPPPALASEQDSGNDDELVTVFLIIATIVGCGALAVVVGSMAHYIWSQYFVQPSAIVLSDKATDDDQFEDALIVPPKGEITEAPSPGPLRVLASPSSMAKVSPLPQEESRERI